MYTFERREEYTSFLQEEAGVSGSIFGFYAGVREAWGSSSAQTRNSYMALLDVNIERCIETKMTESRRLMFLN